MAGAPSALTTLVERYDTSVFDPVKRDVRIRLRGAGERSWDVVFDRERPRLERARADRSPQAVLRADKATWAELAGDLSVGMTAFREGRLSVRQDLNVGVGFLAATAAPGRDRRLVLRQVETASHDISITEVGSGPPVLMIHGLGATKASFLPTLEALGATHRAIAIDLPGFGDSSKPIRASYTPAFFARAVVEVMDALEIDRASIVGNSMGGRAAIEVGLRFPDRVDRLIMLASSLAWLRSRPWALPLRLLPPQLGLVQPAPRAIVERIVRHVVPGADEEWTAAGLDEFLRSYLTPRGRSAFYTAARQIYLEDPRGSRGFWDRLPAFDGESLFVWGRQDRLVPISFARHVQRVLPAASHLELDCGHVPQLEAPGETHDAILAFLAGRPVGRRARQPVAA